MVTNFTKILSDSEWRWKEVLINSRKKIHLVKLLPLLVLSAALLLLNGCNDSDVTPVYKTLINTDYLGTQSVSTLKILLPAGGIDVPSTALQYDADIYRVTYRTTYKGREIIASGIAGIPKTSKTVSMISIHHGTITAHNEAPSEMTTMASQGALLCGGMASIGMIALYPDFLGFGSSSMIPHPYYVEELSASVVIDYLKAGLELADSKNIQFNKKLFLAGYSEGGYVTMAAHKYLEENPTSEFTLVASFPAAGGYDVKAMQEYLFAHDRYVNPYYLAFVAYAYQQTYDWTQSMGDFFNEPYASKIPDLFNGSYSSSQINEQLTYSIPDLVKSDLIETLDTDIKYKGLAEALQKNSLTDWTPKIPMYMYHGQEDAAVPFQNSQSVYDQLIDRGASKDVVHLIPLAKATHDTGVMPYIEDAVLKIIARN